MDLKLFSLRRLWKNWLDLRRSSNRMLIIIVKVLFIDETTKRNVHHLMRCVGFLVLTKFVESRKNL